MNRRLLIVLLSLGAIGGFGSAFFHAGQCHQSRRDAFERHIAKVCVDAARTGNGGP
ncbi:MAG: hypothetical protein U0174_24515 [Polyangiaceae bacterium]